MSGGIGGVVILEERLRIPAEACSFAGFRLWTTSDRFPEEARIDFLGGDIEVETSPEDLHTHGIVKTAIVMSFTGASREEAEAMLEQHGGVIRRVLDRPPPPVMPA